MNGRLGDDKGEGRVTCKGVSTVDYCICTSSLLKYCTNFTVIDFCNLCSDVHSPITVSKSGQSTVNLDREHGCDYNINLDIEEGGVKKWDVSKSDQFNERIDPIKIINLKTDIVVNSDMSTIDKPTVNLFVDRLCDIF